MPIKWQMIEAKISPKAFVINGKRTSEVLGQPDAWQKFFQVGKPLRG
jgi:hypothetical protein